MRRLKYFQWVLRAGMTLGLMACSAGGGPGGAVGPTELSPLTTSNNAATPMQISGTSSPNLDPDPDPSVMYRAFFKEGDLVEGEHGIELKGILRKNRPDSPDINGRILKIIDRRVKKYFEIEIDRDPKSANEASFAVELPIEAISLENLLQGKDLNFYLLANATSTLDQLTDCETAPCLDSTFGYVKIYNPKPPAEAAKAQEKTAPPPPAAPGAPPSGAGLEKPEIEFKDLPMPGKKKVTTSTEDENAVSPETPTSPSDPGNPPNPSGSDPSKIKVKIPGKPWL